MSNHLVGKSLYCCNRYCGMITKSETDLYGILVEITLNDGKKEIIHIKHNDKTYHLSG